MKNSLSLIASIIMLLFVAFTILAPVTAFWSDDSFVNPPNEHRIVQYQLNNKVLQKYPDYGIGGYMGFFYRDLYPKGYPIDAPSYKKSTAKNISKFVEAAHKGGSPVWLADDNGYPSGMAGGRVIAQNPEFEVKSLTLLTVEGSGLTAISYKLPEDLHDIIHAKIYSVKDGVVQYAKSKTLKHNAKGINTSSPYSGDWVVYVYARYLRDKLTQAQSTMPQFKHTGRYPDLMNEEAMASFINNVHAPILSLIENASERVEGFYTNEPNLMQTHWTRASDAPYACIPWTAKLPQKFKEMHGYSLADRLPALFMGDDPNFKRVRIHYRQTVAELLTHSFAKQIKDFCNSKGVKSSGHFLLNDYLSMHVQGYGDLMKFASQFDVPGIDIGIPNFDRHDTFRYQQTRFFSSIASWKNQKSVILLLDPIISGGGLQRLSPSVPILLNSINMAFFHGANQMSSYLPLDPKETTGRRPTKAAGYEKEDFRFVNEYIGRLSMLLRGASRGANVALYYPITNFQGELVASNKFWPAIRNKYEDLQNAWDETEKKVLDEDIEYLIVHPEAVEDAAITEGKLAIGEGRFEYLIMPKLNFIPLSVVHKIKQFEAAGGTVIWIDAIPQRAEYGKNDKLLKNELKGYKAIDISDISSFVKQPYHKSFNLDFSLDSDELIVGRFYKENKQVYYLVNRAQKDIEFEVTSLSGSSGQLKLLDPVNGNVQSITLPTTIPLIDNKSLLIIQE